MGGIGAWVDVEDQGLIDGCEEIKGEKQMREARIQ